MGGGLKNERGKTMTAETKNAVAAETKNVETKDTKAKTTKKVTVKRAASKKPAAKKAVKAAPKAEAPAEEKTESMSACATRMVLEGKSNEEILLALISAYGLPETHRHYPAWYRAAAVRKGLISKADAKKHA